MSQRRSHVKSRRGCTQCKQRRVKCDEVAPICGKCSTRRIRCDFQDWSSAISSLNSWKQPASSSAGPDRHAESASQTPVVDDEAQPTKRALSFDAADLMLMHHFILYTALDISPIVRQSYHDIWQRTVPVLAESCPFLLHVILAIAACHKAHLSATPTIAKPYIVQARQHFSLAMQLFTKSPTDFGHASILLPFTILVLLTSFHLGLRDSIHEKDAVNAFIEILALSRRSVLLLFSNRVDVLNSEVAGLLDHKREARDGVELADDVHQALDSVTEHVDRLPSEEQQSYLGMLEKLRVIYFSTGVKPQNWAHLMEFGFHMDSQFFKLLQSRQPLALVLMAYWCVLLHHAPSRWFFGDWASLTIRAVAVAVKDKDVHALMAWPLLQVNQD